MWASLKKLIDERLKVNMLVDDFITPFSVNRYSVIIESCYCLCFLIFISLSLYAQTTAQKKSIKKAFFEVFGNLIWDATDITAGRFFIRRYFGGHRMMIKFYEKQICVLLNEMRER